MTRIIPPEQSSLFCPDCRLVCAVLNDKVRCPGCGQEFPVAGGIPVFTGELTAEQHKNREYTDKLCLEMKDNSESPVSSWTDEYSLSASSLLKRLTGEKKFARVLDLGCGSGQLTLELSKNGRFADEVYGLDISLSALSSFRHNVSGAGKDISLSLLCSGAEKVFMPDGFFDAVICHKFIHHVRLQTVLKEAARLLKPGGYFICFREPYMNAGETFVRELYFTLINSLVFIAGRSKGNGKIKECVARGQTPKFLYSRDMVDKELEDAGFNKGKYCFTKCLLSKMKMLLYPFILKFPRGKPFFAALLRSAYALDSVFLEKILPERFLREMSFCARRK